MQAVASLRYGVIFKVACNLLDVLDDTTIALKTGLTNAQVAQLRQESR